MPEHIGCIGPSSAGVASSRGMRSGLWRLDAAGRPLAMLAANPESQASSRFNDGRCDRQGRFWAGTVDETKSGGLAHPLPLRRARPCRYGRRSPDVERPRLQPGRALPVPCRHAAIHGVPLCIRRRDRRSRTARGCGCGWSRAATTVAGPTERRSMPRGCYWTALYEGGRVRRYRAPDGRLWSSTRCLPAVPPWSPSVGMICGPSTLPAPAPAGPSAELAAPAPVRRVVR